MDSAIRRQGSTASMLKMVTYGAIQALREAWKKAAGKEGVVFFF